MKIRLQTAIYPIEAILNTCYAFIDKFYFFLDSDPRGKRVEIFIKPKKKGKNLRSWEDQFKNELIHSALRYKISASNRKIREYIIGSALYSNELLTSSEKLNYQDDPLGIAKPWEEEQGKKNARA